MCKSGVISGRAFHSIKGNVKKMNNCCRRKSQSCGEERGLIKDLVGKDYYNYVALMGRSSAQRCHGGDRANCSVREMGKKERLVAMISVEHKCQ